MPDFPDLYDIDILDGEHEPEFDRITAMASRILNCPVALFSIIDAPGDRQFFKSETGLTLPWSARRETPLTHSFCKTVVEEQSVIRVTDAREDARFKDNPAVEDLDVIAYLGAPVTSENGQAIGALCGIAPEPRSWGGEDAENLVTLAASLSQIISLRVALAKQRHLTQHFEMLEHRFSDLARNVPGAIFRYQLFPDGKEALEYMSPGCSDIWEATSEEIRADTRHLWDIICPEDLTGMKESVEKSASELSPWRHRWKIVTRSGVKKTLQGFGQPTKLDDGSVLWNSAVFDITREIAKAERIRDQDQMLAETQKQELVGRLAGGVAHDFNNLLAIVMGNAELLLSDLSTANAKTFLTEIVEAARRGSDLTRSLLSFARKATLQPEILDVSETVAAMQSLVTRTLPANIAVQSRLGGDLWSIEADRSEFERALLNLVLNARDAMSDGGELKIETCNVVLREGVVGCQNETIPPGDYVQLSVTDTGVGIPAEVIGRVFEPFFSTKGPDKGTGLGLAMVLGFAKQSGGAVQILSEEAQGTTVRVYLRACESATKAVQADPGTEPAPVRSGRLLVVEDNEALRRSLVRTLQQAGFETVEAGSADDALTLVDGSRPEVDLVLTDVVMPGQLQGPDLVRRIRSSRSGLPAVFMSGYPQDAYRKGEGIASNDQTLVKPIARKALLSALDRALGYA